MKRKKLWITLAVVCVVILALGLTFGLAFRLKTVYVEFSSREQNSRLESDILDKVKFDGDFDYGKNILFLDTTKSIERIEKNNPYVRVDGTEKSFPNILIVYISERVPRYRIQKTNSEYEWYIVDEDFKVLDKVSTPRIEEHEYYNITTEIDPETLTVTDCYIGDFLKLGKDYDKFINAVGDGVYGRDLDSASALSIKIEQAEGSDELVFVITMRNSTQYGNRGCRIIVTGTDDLAKKVFLGVTVFEQETKDHAELNINANTITVEKMNGEYQARCSWAEEATEGSQSAAIYSASDVFGAR